jgi:release factor glutamine methyltransferase
MEIESFRRELITALLPLHGEQEAKAIAKRLLAHLTGQRWSGLGSLSPAQVVQAQAAQHRLQAGEPIQHVMGLGHFYGREFLVSPDVLIPRPETEELVIWARDLWQSQRLPRQGGRALDLGTGSGCIAITLELELAARGITAAVQGADLSPQALAMARQNARRLSAQATFLALDVLQASPHDFTQLNVLISNPPYIPQGEAPTLHQQVRDHEPGLALFVPDDRPLLFYQQIAALGRHWLGPGGWLLLETHQDYGQAVADLLRAAGYQGVTLRQDLSGRDRMVGGQWAG